MCWLAALWEEEAEPSRCATRSCTVVSRSRAACWLSIRQALKFIVQIWDGLRQTWKAVTDKLNASKYAIFSKWWFKVQLILYSHSLYFNLLTMFVYHIYVLVDCILTDVYLASQTDSLIMMYWGIATCRSYYIQLRVCCKY